MLYNVIRVTSLADSGSGTLRNCVSQKMPRVCIFEVSGRIKLASDLLVDSPDLIVVGQTAPSPGVLITNGGFTIQTHDVRIEHLALRSGDGSTGTDPSVRRSITVQGTGTKNIKLKNLSMSWGVDSNITLIGAVEDVVVQDSIISEALWHSISPLGARGNGVLVGQTARGIVFSGNLLAANVDRNIRWKYDTQGEMLNNVIYNWGGTSSWNTTNISDLDTMGIPTYLDVIGNVYRPGPDGSNSAYAVYSQATPSNSRVFLSDNIAPVLTNVGSQYLALQRIFAGPAVIAGSDTFDSVLAKAGSRPWDRNADDLRVFAGVRNYTLRVRDSVGTWPTYAVNTRAISVVSDPITEADLDAAMVLFETK
jgi:hypothetical protein